MIDKFLGVPFYDGDKGFSGMNCGVFVNSVRSELLGKSPSYFGLISKIDKDKITQAFHDNKDRFKEGKRNGAVACVFEGDTLVHVGVLLNLDEGWRILHITETHGVRKDKVGVFERFRNVRYFYD